MKKNLLLIVLIYSNIVSAQDTIPVKSPEDKHKITEIDSTNKEDKELIEKLNKKYLNQEFYFYMDYTNTFNQIKFVKSKIINIEYNYYNNSPVSANIQFCTVKGDTAWITLKIEYYKKEFMDITLTFNKMHYSKFYKDVRYNQWQNIKANRVVLNMNEREVSLSWGYPKHETNIEFSWGYEDIWYYPQRNTYLYFHNDILKTIQRID